MEQTALFEFPFPDEEDAPDGPVQIGLAVTAIETRLAILELLLGTPGSPAAPAPGDLVIVNGTSDPAYKAATGDVTNNSAGVFTIGAEKVATTMMKNLAVTAAKIAAEAVETAKLANLSVTEGKLAALAVTAAKLAAEAVETGKIKALAVTEAKLAAEAVTTGKIAAGAVTPPKFGQLPSCRVTREAAQAIADSTYTPISWTGGERWDNDGMHNPAENADRITAKTAGLYLAQGFFTFAGDPDGIRNAVISLNEAVLPAPGKAFAEHSEKGCEKPAEGAGGNAINITAVMSMKVNDIARLMVWQNSGGALNVMAGDAIHIAEFSLTWLGPQPV